MKSNNSNHITEDKVSRVAEILKLGKVKHYDYEELLIKCPFCRAKAHSFFVNMTTGEYCCPICDAEGNFSNLDFHILGHSFEEETYDILDLFERPNLAGSFLCFHFINKDLDDILSVARFTPSLISVRNDNCNDFELLYYFSNLKQNTVQYKVIALRLLYDFEKLMSKKISDKNFMNNYSISCVNNVFYKMIDHYSDSQLNSLIELFGNRLNAD